MSFLRRRECEGDRKPNGGALTLDVSDYSEQSPAKLRGLTLEYFVPF